MSDPQCAQLIERSRWDRLIWHVSHRSWWYTTPVAHRLFQWTNWTQEPQKGRQTHRWLRRWLGGLNVACWTHVCGHGLGYSFLTGCIIWAPRYAKRKLRLP